MQHVTDDTLERYVMQTLPDLESGPLEEHLLICRECRDRLETEIEYVTAMRAAAAKIREHERKEDGVGMVCEEKMRLLDEYTAASSLLITAMTKLHGKAGVEFWKALTASEAARAKCVKARLALLDHKTRCETCGSWRPRKRP